MKLDRRLSEKFFKAVEAVPFFSRLAVGGAKNLVWVLVFTILFWQIFVYTFEVRSFLAVIISVAVVWSCQLSLAYLINRRRPFQQNHEKPLLKILWNTPSFPSGHTSLACAMAAAVFVQDPVWGAGFFILAAIVGLSRVAVGVHYFSDIIGGAVLGIGVGTVVVLLVV